MDESLELWEQLNALRMVVEAVLSVANSRDPEVVQEIGRTLEHQLVAVRSHQLPGDEATLQMALDLVHSSVE